MSGGSVYLTKPYSLKVMLSYVEKALKRRTAVPKDITYGSLRFNTLSATAFWNDTDLLLSQKEFSVLLLLAESKGKPVSSDTLLKTISLYTDKVEVSTYHVKAASPLAVWVCEFVRDNRRAKL
jgi:DNA-binding response OmpR family regulator